MAKRRILVERSFTYSGMDMHTMDGKYAEEVIALLQELVDRHGESTLKFEVGPDYEDEWTLKLMLEREETDEEYKTRMAIEERNKKNIEEWERKQLEALLKKYKQE